jgi:hypothetical protein
MDVGRGAMTTTSELTPQIRSEEQRAEELERDRTDIISCSPARRRSPRPATAFHCLIDPDHSDLPAKSCLLIDYYMPGMDGLVRNANWGRTDHPLRDGSSLASTRGRLRGQRYILAQSSGDRTAAHAAATANPTHHRNANWGRTDHPLRDGSSLASTRGRLRGQRYILTSAL